MWNRIAVLNAQPDDFGKETLRYIRNLRWFFVGDGKTKNRLWYLRDWSGIELLWQYDSFQDWRDEGWRTQNSHSPP